VLAFLLFFDSQMVRSGVALASRGPAKEQAMLAIHTILQPTDFSESSRHAFRLACALAWDYGARVIRLHVAAPPAAVDAESASFPQPEGYLERLRKQLEQVAPRDLEVPVEHRVTEGHPATEILRVAEETCCDVIVMGTHGRTGLGRLFLGSVAEQVLRRAPCPVVTARVPVREAGPAVAPPDKAETAEAV
jgi:nucleotide-binding universal stress UspA family protein